jgi:diguanylate cyclase (GGDEF)-like protein
MALIAIAFGAALLVGDHGVPVDGWVFITISLVVASETLGSLSSRLRREAQTDALTGLLNRKGLAPAAERAFAIADRTDLPLTIALIDLDHFKQINDRHGHPTGDRVLIDLTSNWRAELEAGDIFARLGGDEFLLVLVSSSVEESQRLLERLRFVSPTGWTAGVAVRKRGESLGSCLAKTDAALYQAKRARKPSSGEVPDPLPATSALT